FHWGSCSHSGVGQVSTCPYTGCGLRLVVSLYPGSIVLLILVANRRIMNLKLMRLACTILPLFGFFLAIILENKYVTYSVVPITILLVLLLFYFEEKDEQKLPGR